MKKLTCVLAILVCLLTMAGVDTAQAATQIYVPKTLELRDIDGKPYREGETVEIRRGSPLTVYMYPGDANGDGVVDDFDFHIHMISDDEVVTLTTTDRDDDLTITYNLRDVDLGSSTATLLGTATLNSSSATLNEIAKLFITYSSATIPEWSPAAALHIRSSDPWTALYPKKIIFTDKNFKQIDSIRLEGMETRELYLATDDVNNDGIINADDYMQVTAISAEYESTLSTNGSSANASMTAISLLTNPEGSFPRRLATVTVTGIQPDGGESEILYTTFSYQLELSYDDVFEDTHDLTITETPTLTVSVYPKDDGGGDGSDGGGTCNVFGAGAFLFLAIPLALRKKSA